MLLLHWTSARAHGPRYSFAHGHRSRLVVAHTRLRVRRLALCPLVYGQIHRRVHRHVSPGARKCGILDLVSRREPKRIAVVVADGQYSDLDGAAREVAVAQLLDDLLHAGVELLDRVPAHAQAGVEHQGARAAGGRASDQVVLEDGEAVEVAIGFLPGRGEDTYTTQQGQRI